MKQSLRVEYIRLYFWINTYTGLSFYHLSLYDISYQYNVYAIFISYIDSYLDRGLNPHCLQKSVS